MNLIQIKQIDGLQDSLNSLSATIYNLDQEVISQFQGYDNFWGQLYWDQSHIEVNSQGSTAGGRDDIALNVSSAGIRVAEDSYFENNFYCIGSLKVNNTISGNSLVSSSVSSSTAVLNQIDLSGDLNANSSVGQIKFLSESGETKELRNIFQPTYSGASSPEENLSPQNSIVGVDSYNLSQNSLLILPSAASSVAQEIVIKDEGLFAQVYPITISGLAGETIDSLPSCQITGSGGYLRVYSNGQNWFEVNSKMASI